MDKGDKEKLAKAVEKAKKVLLDQAVGKAALESETTSLTELVQSVSAKAYSQANQNQAPGSAGPASAEKEKGKGEKSDNDEKKDAEEGEIVE